MSYKLIDSEKFHGMQATVETVRFDDGMTVKRLVSYDSVVCDVDVDKGTVFFYPRYQYSPTTIRQVTRFLNEYVPLAERWTVRRATRFLNEYVPLAERWNIALVRELQKNADTDGFVVFREYAAFFLPHVLGTTRSW